MTILSRSQHNHRHLAKNKQQHILLNSFFIWWYIFFIFLIIYFSFSLSNTFESFTLSIIGALLVDGETSPFYQSLLVPNIGSDYSPVIG